MPAYHYSAAKPDRHMLSTSRTEKGGWTLGPGAFHAHGPETDGKDRIPIYAFTCDATPSTSGWHYSPSRAVKGWTAQRVAFQACQL